MSAFSNSSVASYYFGLDCNVSVSGKSAGWYTTNTFKISLIYCVTPPIILVTYKSILYV